MSLDIIPKFENIIFKFVISILFTAFMRGVMTRYRVRYMIAPMMSFIHSGVLIRVRVIVR